MSNEEPSGDGGGSGVRLSAPARLRAPSRLRFAPAQLRALRDEDSGEPKKTARIGLRLSITAVIILGLFTVMIGRLWTLQVLQTQTFKKAEITTSSKVVPIVPIRGLIFARGGQLLVSNRLLAVVTLSRSVAKSDPVVITRLASLLRMSVADVQAQVASVIYSPYEPAPIKYGATMEQVLYIAEHAKYLPGVSVTYQARRKYPRGDVNSTLLGFVGDINQAEYNRLKSQGYQYTDVVGQFGAESAFEQWLRGQSGHQRVLIDPAGDVLGVRKTIPARPGNDVVLSLDLGLQHELDTALASQMAALRAGTPTRPAVPADWGAAVVLDPQNGQVLALSSVTGANLSHDQTYAISGYSTPGSTFKLVTATAALNTGLISPVTNINDPGYINLCASGPFCKLYNSPGESPAGYITVSQALTRSDDVFFYTLGKMFYDAIGQYGKTPIQNMAALYGLGQPTNINIPGEGPGQVDNPSLPQHRNGYFLGDQVEMAFGQGATELTALQLANEYATFANGGTRYQPQVAAAIVSPSGVVVKQFASIVDAHVPMPASTREAILTGLEGAMYDVHHGTAAGTFLGYKGFPLAGKTGTATTFGNRPPNGLFVAFGPCAGLCAPTDPRYVVAVIIDQAGYGAAAAAPVVRSVFEYLNKHPVQPFVVPAHPAA